MTVEFRLLGEPEACVHGHPVVLGHSRQLSVLSALLVDANRVVTTDHLVDRVWGNRPPRTVRNTLHSYLSRLRQALAAAENAAIVRQPSGYVMEVDPEAVDIHRFQRLVHRARDAGDDSEAIACYEQALGLWRGEPFGTLDTPWFLGVRETLERERFAAEAECADLQLASGRHTHVLAELSSRIVDHPLDERLACQFMLALHRCGRPYEALEHYRRIRQRLARELGTDPGPALRKLQQQILTADPALDVPAATAKRSDSPVPHQLPAPPPGFVGRRRELAELSQAAGAGSDALTISAISGSGGIGKTWLALHWAHANLERFPDGQLYLDLGGFDPAGTPISAGVAIRAFLDALGVAPSSVPSSMPARTALYRSLVAGKRMLVVLDNARDSAHVEPLLPGSASCTVLVTSRNQLGDLVSLHGARPVQLDMLSEPEARTLLASRLGDDRTAAEPDAVAALLEQCGGLPLALSIVTARAATHAGLPLAMLAEELRETTLDALSMGELNGPRRVFSASYRALSSETADVFRLLGLFVGPDISLPAVAGLAGLPLARTRTLLQHLDVAHLVQRSSKDRYRMHDLVRLYAGECAQALPSAVRASALRRLVGYYLHTGYAADRLLAPHAGRFDPAVPIDGFAEHPLPDQTAALAWFGSEHVNLLATQEVAFGQGWYAAAWQLARVLSHFNQWRADFQANITMWQLALSAASRLGDAAPLAEAHRRLGPAYARMGDYSSAFRYLERGLAVCREAGEAFAFDEAHIHQSLAMVLISHGEYRRALRHDQRALAIFRRLGDVRGEAGSLNTMGLSLTHLAQRDQARIHCERALSLYRQYDDAYGEACTLDSLGFLAHDAGRLAEAVSLYRQSLELFREIGNSGHRADGLERLGDVYADLRQPDQAHDAWEQACDLYRAQHRTPEAERVQEKVSALLEQ